MGSDERIASPFFFRGPVPDFPFPIFDFFPTKKIVAREKRFSYLVATSAHGIALAPPVIARREPTGDRDRMTRIGFAYNQKPDDSTEDEGPVGGSSVGSIDEDQPSFAGS